MMSADRFVVAGALLVLIGIAAKKAGSCDVFHLAVLGFILNSWAQFVHSSAVISLGPFERLFVSPRFHRVHHSVHEGIIIEILPVSSRSST
jgi:sterol desaturase/sphingolipid hydroxylase (fatty acid hydroxylase superfamily)